MKVDTLFRRLRGVVGNALTWGAGWFALGFAVSAILSVTGLLSLSWTQVLVVAIKAGIVGGVVGGAFSGFVMFLYRGKRLSEISWVRFGISGAVVTGLFVPLFLQTMNLLSGSGLVPWELVLDDGLWTSAFGGAAAAGSLKLAQLTDPLLPGGKQDRLDRPEGVEFFESLGEGDTL